ncbi:hypothetical protein C8R45DRAFT_917807 [Mycena sanguinolenta]|nr:hypothetical protein C8R45DRAFT_917807 [Mycena sanguinolenta]
MHVTASAQVGASFRSTIFGPLPQLSPLRRSMSLLKSSTPTPTSSFVSVEETNHTTSDNERDANLGHPDAYSDSGSYGEGPSLSVEDRHFLEITGGAGGPHGGEGGIGGDGRGGGSGGYGEGPSLSVEDRHFLEITGGTGGEGGIGGDGRGGLWTVINRGLTIIGGSGGYGEGPSLSVEDLRFSEITGGAGGTGGRHGGKGGIGGRGQAPDLLMPLLSIDEKFRMPNLTVAEFCQRYSLSKKICSLLEEQGFETAGELLEVSSTALRDAGFKGGHILELKRALNEVFYSRAPRSSV